jgi:nicotinamidase-related amidase
MAELLAPTPRDRSILKPRHSAFYETPLAFLLEELGIARLILTGIAADNCVMFTAGDSYLRRYPIWVPRDCVASENPGYTRMALDHMHRVLKASTLASAATLEDAFRARG